MDFETAFWIVFHKIFRWRPIVMGCCDCHGTFYLTKNKIIRNLKDERDEDNPVFQCPYCGLEHLCVFVRLDNGVRTVKFEVEHDE